MAVELTGQPSAATVQLSVTEPGEEALTSLQVRYLGLRISQRTSRHWPDPARSIPVPATDGLGSFEVTKEVDVAAFADSARHYSVFYQTGADGNPPDRRLEARATSHSSATTCHQERPNKGVNETPYRCFGVPFRRPGCGKHQKIPPALRSTLSDAAILLWASPDRQKRPFECGLFKSR
jgi:hypothetical protein